MNLKTKFHLASALLVLVVVAGMMSSLYFTERRNLFEEARQGQKEDLQKLESVYAEAMVQNDQLIYLNYVKTLVSAPKIEYAGFVGKKGDGWIYTDQEKELKFTSPADALARKIGSENRFISTIVPGLKDKKIVEMARPSRNGDMVRLGFNATFIEENIGSRLAETLKKLTIVGVIAFAFGLFLASLLSHRITRPLSELTLGAERIAGGDKGVKIREGGKDEIGALTRTFNHMSEELAKLDELKDEFMAHVTHELRSPLTSIIATTELLGENHVAQNDPKIKRSVERLAFGSERLNRLVDNILDLTRMEAGKMNFDSKPLNMGSIVYEMADFFQPRAKEKKLYIRAEAPEEMPMAVGDEEKIRQVLSNLIHNALKFTNAGGVTISVEDKKTEAVVAVRDTGVGIPKENLKSVFSKFETLQDTRDRVLKPVPGTGLGLNIVLNSIKAQRGRVWVESEVDRGTTFFFSLPLARGMAWVKAQKPMPEDELEKPNKKRARKRGPVVVEERKAV